MKLRKSRLFSLLLTFVLMLSLTSPALAAEDMVAINEANFPDPIFRSYVTEKFDSNKDSQLSASERNLVTKIWVEGDSEKGEGITSLEGIHFFPNLEILYCDENKLTSLDLRGNPNLKELSCRENELTSLDVKYNPKLTELICWGNKLTSLDVSQNQALTLLSCSRNQLEELDLSQNLALTVVYCGYNQIRTLHLGKNTVLQDLICNDNQLTNLDLTQNPALTYLECPYNQLIDLNLRQNPRLEELGIQGNHLTSLDLHQNTMLRKVSAGSNRYEIVVGASKTCDLRKLPAGFDLSKANQWQGGTVSGHILNIDKSSSVVTYSYDTGSPFPLEVILNVTVQEHLDDDTVYRIYNPGNGKHHYTIDAAERDFLAANGWIYEGIAWYAPKEGAPIYRVYNPGNDNHLYTTDAAERDCLVEGGWQYEGILCYSADETGTPLYRVLNPYTTLNPHHYTDSWEECEFLESNGWKVEGISWYGLK